MSVNCEKCLKGINKRVPGIKCGMCVSIYHIKCVDVSDEVLRDIEKGSANWMCIDCRSRSNCSLIDVAMDGNDINSDTQNKKINDLIVILKGMQVQLESLKDSSNYVCKTLDDMKVVMSQLSNDNKQLNERLSHLEKKHDDQESKINIMEAQMDRSAQILNQNNIVVCGIPSTYENVTGIVVNIVHKTGIEITKDDLLSIKPMVHLKDSISQLKNSFIVSFKTNEMKNNIINTFRKNKTLNTDQLDDEFRNSIPNQRIFMLHHLTRFQSKLYNAAKTIKNKYKLQFLWCKENNIYLRKSADSKIYRIMSFNDISQINSSLQCPSTISTYNSGQSTSAGLFPTSGSDSQHHD